MKFEKMTKKELIGELIRLTDHVNELEKKIKRQKDEFLLVSKCGFIKNNPDIIFVLSEDNRNILANKKAEEMSG